MNTPTGIEAQVCQDIADRQAHGIAKYGMTVADNSLLLTEWTQHLYEELLDAAVYIKRMMLENRKIQDSERFAWANTREIDVARVKAETERDALKLELQHYIDEGLKISHD